MPKGHSTYETRLKATEALCDELLTRLQFLELRFKDYRVSTADTAVQNANMTYKPQFEKWPGNGSPQS
jgi:hypothetical protein